MTRKLSNVCIVALCLPSVCIGCYTPVCKTTWSSSEIPHPSAQNGLCGRYCKMTRICDPCKILSNKTGTLDTTDELDKMLESVTSHNTGIVCEYEMKIAIINQMKTQGYLRDTKLAKYFANNLREWDFRWPTDPPCSYNTIVIFISTRDRQVYTSVGKKANSILTDKCIKYIYEEAKKDYLSDDNYGEGLKYMVSEYRKTLADGECSQKPLPLGAIIVGSVCGVLLIAILTWSFTIWRSSGYNCSCQGDGTWGGFSAGGGGSDGGGGGGGGGGSGGGGGGF